MYFQFTETIKNKQNVNKKEENHRTALKGERVLNMS